MKRGFGFTDIRNDTFLKHKLVLVVLFVFIACFTLGLLKYFREIQSKHWPTTTGVITQSQPHFAYGMKHFTGFVPVILYRYTVSGQEFTGTRITFHAGEHLHTKENAEALLKPYSVGQAVPVYYDPNEPSASVLQPGIQDEQRWIFYLGIGYIPVCSIAFLWVLFDYRKKAVLMKRHSPLSSVRLN
jgi:hypothetical protein